jgi:hypothetical protein
MVCTDKAPFCLSGCDALDVRWAILFPSLTGSPSHRIVLATYVFVVRHADVAALSAGDSPPERGGSDSVSRVISFAMDTLPAESLLATLRRLAREFREQAAHADLPGYGAKLIRTAEDLEKLATDLETAA